VIMRVLRRRKTATKRGYTAVEVLVAMTLFAIGAAGVVGMQRTVVQGGNDARRFDVATNITHIWLERLQRDSMVWTQPNAQTQTSNLGSTMWLNALTTSACTTNWCPPASTPPSSGAFDMWGRDLGAASATVVHEFCAQYKLNFIAGGNPPPPGTIIRAEVRTVWARIDRTPISNCNSFPGWPAGDPDGATRNNYHFVYASTTLRPNPNPP